MPTSSFNLSDLDGSNGFVINGLNPGDNLGFSVSSAGDINGDGIEDLVIGGPNFTRNLPIDTSYSVPSNSYVIFGSSELGSSGRFDLTSLDGSNGFVINGTTPQPLVGYPLIGGVVGRAGDVNADGFDDLLIFAPGEAFGISSETFILFGGSDIGSSGNFDVSTLDGSNGFTMRAGMTNSASSAGDINGDGIDDLIFGEPSGYGDVGTSYIIFGGTDLGGNGVFELFRRSNSYYDITLNGTNGFVVGSNFLFDSNGSIVGRNRYNADGGIKSVSGAGDINGDGFDDLIIGVPDGVGIFNSGPLSECYVIFGGTNVGGNGTLDVAFLNGSNGFVINNPERYDSLGWSVSRAGDINGDGIDDLIIGAPGGDSGYGGTNESSKSYILFGGADIATTGSDLSLLDGTNGFVINGINPGDELGYSVSNAGDINNDGIVDLIIGAPNADPNGNNSGSTYIVFGGAGVGAGGSFDLSSLDGNNGFVLNGINLGDRLGFSVSGAGDVNGDGIADVIIGAPGTDANGNSSGSSYVVFGSPVEVATPTTGDDTILGTNSPDILRGLAGNDFINGRNGNDILLGNRGNDTLIGGNGDDLLFGGWGKDVLTGGAGSDRFILSQNSGTDTITDFESGIDSLVLLGNLTFDQLTITQSNNDTLLSLASNNQVIANLTGVSANTLSAADFINL